MAATLNGFNELQCLMRMVGASEGLNELQCLEIFARSLGVYVGYGLNELQVLKAIAGHYRSDIPLNGLNELQCLVLWAQSLSLAVGSEGVNELQILRMIAAYYVPAGPICTVLPTLTSDGDLANPVVGDTLTIHDGTFVPPLVSSQYVFYRRDTLIPPPPGGSQSYTLTSDDVGFQIKGQQFGVDASNQPGSAFTLPSGVVVAPGGLLLQSGDSMLLQSGDRILIQ